MVSEHRLLICDLLLNSKRGTLGPPLAVRMGIIAARDALHIRREICIESGIPRSGIGVHVLGYKRDNRKWGRRGGRTGRTISRSTNCSSI